MDKKEANILLLSDKEFEYQTLVDAGYKNVFWFKSALRAYKYFKTHQEELKKFDIVLRGSRVFMEVDLTRYIHLFYKSLAGMKKLCFSSSKEGLYSEKLFSITAPDEMWSNISANHFLSILNDTIPDKLKNEKIEIPEVAEKEIVLPKKREDVRVLFMGSVRNKDLVENYFKEEGFEDYTFINSNNSSLSNNIGKLAKYDLVVVDSGFNGKLSMLGDEFHEYMKDKGKSIYFVVYDFNYKRTFTNNFSVEGLSTENPQDLRKIKFESLETEEDALKDVLGCVLYLYTSYNKDIKSGSYSTITELMNKHAEKRDDFCKRLEFVNHCIYMLDDIQTYLNKYRNLVNSGTEMRPMKGLKVDILEDGVSAAVIDKGIETVRITFRDEEENVSFKKFYLEYLSESGRPFFPMARTYYNSHAPMKKMDNLASDEEMKKIEDIQKIIIDVLKPIVDKMEQSVENNDWGNKNKRYGKKYI